MKRLACGRRRLMLVPLVLLVASRPAAAQRPPSPGRLAEMETQWVDPVTEAPPGTAYHRFDTPSRGPGTQGSYLIDLPPSYEGSPTRRYPVIYGLHGGFGNAREGAWTAQTIDRWIKGGSMPETIVVLPQALPVGWYVNSKDGKRPVEDVLIKDLIPHIDANYRTVARREGRGIEGMSMGGYGALHLGLKYPELFGAISAVAPAILRRLEDEPKERTSDTFGDDQAYYDANHPFALARANAPALRRRTAIRLLGGERDGRLRRPMAEFDSLLTELEVPHEYTQVPGAGHSYRAIIDGVGEDSYTFWKKAFAGGR